ncbi:outer membrane protein transport protein [Sulfurimonas sp. NW7]|uniref:OmpP1/FadL family transporter n=1 Tax=Sulfurimonas sp. NW7 TaxID=2922727 RepID=UPI003DAA3717
MKKTIKLAVVAALALGATSAFATNGSALIGMGAKARGMAGTGIGMSHGAESALTNPALITSVEKTEISFGGTIFMPDVKNENGVNLGPLGDESGSATSDADMSVIPEVSIASKVADNFYIGVGMWGTAGMGVDYRDANDANTGQMNMVTNLQLMQFGVPLAYKISNFSLAVTPILQYGALDINYVMSDALVTAMTGGTVTKGYTVGNGVAQDLSFGFNIGASYEMSGLTIGAVYKSRIDMEYKGQLSRAIQNFGVATYTNDKLSTPAELGIGASYVMGEHTVAIDYKQIKWSDAKGYKDFEWDDQNVISLGYEYTAKNWAARIGYNYASSPISEQSYSGVNGAGLSSGLVNTFNLLGFPGVVESHYAVGGTYAISEVTSFDVAFTYAPEVTNTYKNFLGQNITTKHSQTGLSLQANFAF